MKKFIKIAYFPQCYANDAYHFYANDGKPFQLILAIDSINSISPMPNTWRIYENLEIARYKRDNAKSTTCELYHITTDIARGRGINGVSFFSYDITKEAYENLLANIDLI